MSPPPARSPLCLAQRIVRDAMREHAEPGKAIATLSQLERRYGVGRDLLREALRLLEAHGVISLKPGPGGGSVLQCPRSRHLASAMALLLEIDRAPFEYVIQARGSLEPAICALAARRMSEKTIVELAATLDATRNGTADDISVVDVERAFHHVVASATGNCLLVHLLDSLFDLVDAMVPETHGFGIPRLTFLSTHEGILDALKAHDDKRSAERMRSYMDQYKTSVAERYPHLLAQVVPWSRRAAW